MAEVLPETVTIRNGCSSATVHLFGATLTSWKALNIEALFVSKKSYLDGQKPIRGGVPVIFPQFGPWECGPQHGFARRSKWSINKGDYESDKQQVTLVLEDSEDTRKLWNHKFRFEYTLSIPLEAELKMDVVITNTDEKSFDFTFLLHTYFCVPDVKKCAIWGLEACNYIDKVKSGQLCKEENKKVTISEFTDRIYQNTPDRVILDHASANREIDIITSNLPDTVVWNPWEDNAKKMGDFGDDEWKKMICVESGYVSSPYTLQPGESFTAFQVLSMPKTWKFESLLV